MKIIDNISAKNSLSEIGHGQREVQIAYVNPKNGETITPFCKCKDFFNDMFWSNKEKKDISIYGFKWNHKDHRDLLDKNVLTIAVHLRDRVNKSIYELKEEERLSVLRLLTKISTSAGLGRVVVRMCEEKKNLVIYFNRKWVDTPYLNSAFYFFVRLGFTYDKDHEILSQYNKSQKFISPNDQIYFKKANSRIKDLLEGKIDKNQTYSSYNSGSIHNASGLVNYCGYKID
jgi:hypothetical protein